jgi:hypothetical protein
MTMKTLLVVLLLLVVGTGTAFAECAWALWLHQISMVSGAEKRERSPIAARTNSGECEKQLQSTMEFQSRKPGGKVIGANIVETKTRVGEADMTMILRYVCLPDTIDPRAPKGK